MLIKLAPDPSRRLPRLLWPVLARGCVLFHAFRDFFRLNRTRSRTHHTADWSGAERPCVNRYIYITTLLVTMSSEVVPILLIKAGR